LNQDKYYLKIRWIDSRNHFNNITEGQYNILKGDNNLPGKTMNPLK